MLSGAPDRAVGRVVGGLYWRAVVSIPYWSLWEIPGWRVSAVVVWWCCFACGSRLGGWLDTVMLYIVFAAEIRRGASPSKFRPLTAPNQLVQRSQED